MTGICTRRGLCTLQQFRPIPTRYDKTNRTFLAAVYLAASAILLN